MSQKYGLFSIDVLDCVKNWTHSQHHEKIPLLYPIVYAVEVLEKRFSITNGQIVMYVSFTQCFKKQNKTKQNTYTKNKQTNKTKQNKNTHTHTHTQTSLES